MLIGYTTGVYDMFHVGHLRLLQRARSECDQLIVGVTTDELSMDVKGKLPVVPFVERRTIVSALRCVDLTVPQTSMDKMQAWRNLGFHRMFVGDDWKGSDKWRELEREFSEINVDIVYFPYTKTTSSSQLRDALWQVHGVES